MIEATTTLTRAGEEGLLTNRPGEAVNFRESRDIHDQQQSEYEEQNANAFTTRRQGVNFACDGRHLVIAQRGDSRFFSCGGNADFFQSDTHVVVRQIALEFLPR